MISNLFNLAGVDYSPLSTTILAFDSSMSSRSIPVDIMVDQSDEIGENFDVIITDDVSIRDATGTEIHLSDEERSRILITEDRARVHILESRLSAMKSSMYIVVL